MRKLIFILWLTLIIFPFYAQKNSGENPYSLNEGTLFGAGSSHIKDTYLSPFFYNGWGLRVLNERMKVVKLADYNVSRQQIINVDISFTRNPAEKVNDFGGFVDYSLGYHYRFQINDKWKIMPGMSGHLLGGFVYNTSNGNNPLSAKIDLDLNLSTIFLYNQKIKGRPVTFRYQFDIPVVGVFFAPPYGESYYEIFNVGNASNVVKMNSFHNKFAIKNYLTVDIPLKSFMLRAGFLNSVYYTDANDVNTRIITNSFMIGWVKEFVTIGGKRLNQKKNINTPFY